MAPFKLHFRPNDDIHCTLLNRCFKSFVWASNDQRKNARHQESKQAAKSLRESIKNLEMAMETSVFPADKFACKSDLTYVSRQLSDILLPYALKESRKHIEKSIGHAEEAIGYFDPNFGLKLHIMYSRVCSLTAGSLEVLCDYPDVENFREIYHRSVELEFEAARVSRDFDLLHACISSVNGARKAGELYDIYGTEEYRKLMFIGFKTFINAYDEESKNPNGCEKILNYTDLYRKCKTMLKSVVKKEYEPYHIFTRPKHIQRYSYA